MHRCLNGGPAEHRRCDGGECWVLVEGWGTLPQQVASAPVSGGECSQHCAAAAVGQAVAAARRTPQHQGSMGGAQR